MFDTPDIMPLCIAPIVAIIAGLAAFGISSSLGSIIKKRSGRKEAWIDPLVIMITIAIVPIACVTALFLEIGALSPAPWFTPEPRNIAGTWELSPTTVRLLKEWYDVSVSTHELAFKNDGTFHVQEMPTFWSLLDSQMLEGDKYVSGNGKWHLEQVEGNQRKEWIIFAQFEEINGNPDSRSIRFYFEGHLPPYTLRTLDSAGLSFEFNKK